MLAYASLHCVTGLTLPPVDATPSLFFINYSACPGVWRRKLLSCLVDATCLINDPQFFRFIGAKYAEAAFETPPAREPVELSASRTFAMQFICHLPKLYTSTVAKAYVVHQSLYMIVAVYTYNVGFRRSTSPAIPFYSKVNIERKLIIIFALYLQVQPQWMGQVQGGCMS
ncbi:uncharacterized protein N7525_005975 [Penicillium rubens]|uniref:uncharacterized protein n=1 Tax=Penicillium rubens TaxID=1108849 RepID=UPI002A5A8AF3|nr:uncharacterized protein N7525_005975 [Penicillium rubens]KAJ5840787.1 hypothetical protein N7525_005975 [Penicillium rubens]